MIRKTSPVVACQTGERLRWEWMVSCSQGLFVSRVSYATSAGALRAGRRAWAKIITRMQQGDMP